MNPRRHIHLICYFNLLLLLTLFAMAGMGRLDDIEARNQDVRQELRREDVSRAMAIHLAAQRIVSTDLSGGATSCSATAIGPHALLTASHCITPGARLSVRDDEQNFPLKITSFFDDAEDHKILLVAGASFRHYSQVELRDLHLGESLSGEGNPGGALQLMREGSVIGEYPKGSGYVLQMVVIGGDSGTGLYDARGKLVSVLNDTMTEKDSESREFHAALTFRLCFTPAELQYAALY